MIILEKHNTVAWITLNRPRSANALNVEMLMALRSCLNELSRDPCLRVIVTRGAGKGYSAGSDLRELRNMSLPQAMDSQRLEGEVCRNFQELPQITICSIHGYALGGGFFLALGHDLRLVQDGSRLGAPEVKLGWNPTFGLARLVRMVGLARAYRWVLTGADISLDEAKQCGLIDQMVPAADFEARTFDLTQELSQIPPEGVRQIKKAMKNSFQLTEVEHDEWAVRAFARCLKTPESQRSLQAYGASAHRKDGKG